ncbi:hypothetical protein M1740_20860 [Salmonella enterica subsp. enterica serovar Montevideo]|uniref:hypothetical protein n=1 Tax=Salmonella enterica TaxID=28901 RepID=UPI0021B36724|nr:hypothetical protein [Salmonella enterica]EJX2528445.1 hypothetical protein [Salmonella enterica]MCT7116929.1 hypothetical protein [Salmonella enterica subsp. enterica serovar Montevideo]
MLSFLYLFLVVAGVVALGIIPAEKNKLKNLIAIFVGIFGIAYVMDVFTDHYGAISHETVKSGLPWFAAFVGYAVTAIIYLMCASKQQSSFNLLNVFLLAITGGITSLVLFFVTDILLTL